MNNRPAKRDGTKATIFPKSEGLECLNQAIYRDIQVLRTWKTVFIAPVDCIYGYSYSTLSALLKNVVLFIWYSLEISIPN